jgi:hypothetical protein
MRSGKYLAIKSGSIQFSDANFLYSFIKDEIYFVSFITGISQALFVDGNFRETMGGTVNTRVVINKTICKEHLTFIFENEIDEQLDIITKEIYKKVLK